MWLVTVWMSLTLRATAMVAVLALAMTLWTRVPTLVVCRGLSFAAGLLKNSMFGLVVTVCVSFMCPCTFFDRLDGTWLVILGFSLICVSPLTVCVWVVGVGTVCSR